MKTTSKASAQIKRVTPPATKGSPVAHSTKGASVPKAGGSAKMGKYNKN